MTLKKPLICSKKCIFQCFWQFSPFLYQERITPVALCSTRFFKEWRSLSSLLKKEWPWAIRSRCSWQKSIGSGLLFFTSESLFCSQKTSKSLPLLFTKEWPWASCSFSHANLSFAHKKWVISSKNQWAYSQPCKKVKAGYTGQLSPLSKVGLG